MVLFLLFSHKVKPLLGRKAMQAIPSPQAHTEVRGTRLSPRPTHWAFNPTWTSLGHVPVSERKLTCQNAQMSHGRGGSWLVPGRDQQDWQPDPLLHPGTRRRAEATVLQHKRFSNTATKEYVCMVQLVPLARSCRRWRDGREGQWGGGILWCRERGREGGDLANRSLHCHHSHLPGNGKKNNLVAIVQFAEATPSCFSQKAPCEGIFPRLQDPCPASPGLGMPDSRSMPLIPALQAILRWIPHSRSWTILWGTQKIAASGWFFSAKTHLSSLFRSLKNLPQMQAKQRALGSAGSGPGMSPSYLSCALTTEMSSGKLLLSSISCLLPGHNKIYRAVVSPAQQWPLDVTVIQLISLSAQMALDQAGSILKTMERNLSSVFHPFPKGSINLMGLQMVFSCACPQYHWS